MEQHLIAAGMVQSPRRIGRLAFRLLTSLTVAWGLFAAAALFAIRYDLLPDPAPGAVEAPPPGSARGWPTVHAGNWSDVLPPESALAQARARARAGQRFGTEVRDQDGLIQRLELAWEPRDATAAWVVHLARPSCACSEGARESWDVLRVVVHPLSGEIVEEHFRTALAAAMLPGWLDSI